MIWENWPVLWGLWILPFLAGLLIYAHRKRLAAARRFADPAMGRRLMPGVQGARPWIKGTLLLAALGSLIFAAARPRFGVYYEEVARRGVDLFVLLDVSRSMTAGDLDPSRLERAKLDIVDLLQRLRGDRVGLIVFAGRPVVKVPLTTDQGFFKTVLEDVHVRSAPRGGTQIGDAIRQGIQALSPAEQPERAAAGRDRVMILITDGEDHESFPREAARQAAQRGIKIFTVGLGDAKEGTRVPVLDRNGKRTHYLKHDDQVVWSKLDEALLEDVALATGGAYIPAGTRAYDLGQVYEDHLAGLTRAEHVSQKRKRHRDQFQVFLGFGVMLLLANLAIPLHYRRGASGGAEEANA